ncbi:Delta(7)-sterol 5(6)-desaturase [Malassezia psittaci]|uniref:Delta(7)-sterol 5(6)-desaturase n=1 Tax=Malassezia psittaci TaxID=1821823 RepID=A0AAF0JCZ6_9BASI|nr:Delta(7)-sterol 5(6)-desaturase [Malassezia psittaci]
MDLVLNLADEYVLDAVWARLLPASRPLPGYTAQESLLNKTAHGAQSTLGQITGADKLESWLPRDNIVRQTISLYVITYIGILLLYFSMAGASYYFLFNKELMKHPRFLKNQIKLEIQSSLRAFPWLDLMTVPWFVAEVRGYSRVYEKWDEYGLLYLILSVPFFLLFTDACIYWVHRIEHHPALYKHVHKPHHKWIIPTPFASHAFHPVDGYAQSLPYHIFPVLFPLNKYLFLGLFGFVNMWSIMIHDSDMITGTGWEHIINGPAHHTLHHLYFTCNYGQYTTMCDRFGGSFREPLPEDDPLKSITETPAETRAHVKQEKEE